VTLSDQIFSNLFDSFRVYPQC